MQKQTKHGSLTLTPVHDPRRLRVYHVRIKEDGCDFDTELILHWQIADLLVDPNNPYSGRKQGIQIVAAFVPYWGAGEESSDWTEITASLCLHNYPNQTRIDQVAVRIFHDLSAG